MELRKRQSEELKTKFEHFAKLEPLQTLFNNINDLLDFVGDVPFYCKGKNGKYANIPCSFDIETTSTYIEGKKIGIMYVWQFGLNGGVVMGHTWQEFIDVLTIVQDRYNLSTENKLICFVHNLSFEFQFLRKWFEWSGVFALAPREPVKALCDLGIEFRCSYILSGYSLSRLGDGLQKYKIKKLVGDLDYSKIRHSYTPLTDNEKEYCINDVRVVMAYIQEQIERYGNITRLQLTKTGYVRKYCRDSCMYAGSHKKATWKALNYRSLMERLTIEPNEYIMLKRAFQGGFTHANAYHSGMTRENVQSMDFTSSYPAVICARTYPMSKGEKMTIHNKNEFEKTIKLYHCIFNIKFHGLTIKETAPDCPISKSKCYDIKGECIENNGRVSYCDECITTITNIDFEVIKNYYTWDSYEIGTLYRYKKGYLPTDLIKAVLKLYADKTTLKGVDGREEDYLLSKEMLNSVYGMMVTDICRDENEYSNEEWSKTPANITKAIDQYNEDKKRFLFYPWGIFVTSWARYNLFTGISELGDDFIYADTDSVKYLNPDKHKEYFEKYNAVNIERLKRACKYHKIPFEMVSPKTIKGIEKPLGVWDFDGEYSRFKTLGAKRYAVEHNGKFNITISGVNKKLGAPYLCKGWAFSLDGKKEYNSPFEKFNDGLIFPSYATGKLTHTYIDNEITGTITDYTGITADYHEKSFIHMEGCEYCLSLSMQYISYLIGYRSKTK